MAFLVRTTDTLEGSVRVGGSKNAALKVLNAATMLMAGKVKVDNLSPTDEVAEFMAMQKNIGLECSLDGDARKAQISAQNPIPIPDKSTLREVQYSGFRHMDRLSLPLMVQHERSIVVKGAQTINGARPLKPIYDLLSQVGVSIERSGDDSAELVWTKDKRTNGPSSLVIPMRAHCMSTSEIMMLAGAARRGRTRLISVLNDPELEPLVSLLANQDFLELKANSVGDWSIESEGIDEIAMYEAEAAIPGDYLEGLTIAAAVAAVGGSAEVLGFNPDHAMTAISYLVQMGAEVEFLDEGIRISSSGGLSSIDIETGRHPGFHTDLQGPFLSLLTQCKGRSLLRENIWPDRLDQVKELAVMGASVETLDRRTALIGEASRLKGNVVASRCPRAAAGLLIAALTAEGESQVNDYGSIRRAFPSLIANLSSLGAQIN